MQDKKVQFPENSLGNVKCQIFPPLRYLAKPYNSNCLMNSAYLVTTSCISTIPFIDDRLGEVFLEKFYNFSFRWFFANS